MAVVMDEAEGEAGLELAARLTAAGAAVERVREAAAGEAFAARWCPEVVHVHGRGAAAVRGAVRVSTAHAADGAGRWEQFGAVGAVSRPLQRELEARGLRNVHFVGNAWNERLPLLERRAALAELGLAEDGGVRLGWVGEFRREKGADLAVEALAGWPGGVRLVLVGEGPEEQRLRALTERAGLAGRVDFVGVKPRAGRLMRAFDFLLVTRRVAGTPLVLLEALAAGTPVIATRVGGVPDMVGERESFTCAPVVESVRRALERAIRDPQGARWRAEAGRQRVAERANLAEWLDRHESMYEQARAA